MIIIAPDGILQYVTSQEYEDGQLSTPTTPLSEVTYHENLIFLVYYSGSACL